VFNAAFVVVRKQDIIGKRRFIAARFYADDDMICERMGAKID
jgi:hypothetical protein